MSQTLAGINPRILKWARERSNYSLQDVAEKFKKKPSDIAKWESGETAPTYIQLEKLAYEIYKRPIALFFFPEPPEETDEKQEFRTLPDFEIDKLQPDTMLALREAKAMQLSLKEITDNVNPSEKQIFRDISLSFNDNLVQVTQQVREYLGISLEVQISWKDDDIALKEWRSKLEEYGIFIFKRSFKQKDISGFCLIDSEFPIIYVNNSTVKTRQIFTLFHELAHLLLHTNGITKLDNSYIDSLQGDNKKIEIFCNQFAGEFLFPSSTLLPLARENEINDDFIFTTASIYKVSREVVLRKLYDNKFISQQEYNTKIQLWQKTYEKNLESRSSSSGGNYYSTQAAYLGENYLKLVFGKYYQGKYGIEQVADYLNFKKVQNAEKLEQLLLERNIF